MDVHVREETPADRDAVRRVNDAAFGRDAEGRLVDALRGAVSPVVSLVACDGDEVVGHVLFTPVTVDGAWTAMALGPMAVAPERQRAGVGSALARAGLDACRALGHDVVFVLGHPEYYPRFGFVPAPPRGLTCKWPVPHGGAPEQPRADLGGQTSTRPTDAGPADPRGRRAAAEDAPHVDVFMVAELAPGALRGRTGRVEYAPAFDAVE